MRKFNTIDLSIDRNVATITINRPRFLNALNTEVLMELSEAVDLVDKDSSVRAAIVTGSGEKAFVAGADISEMQTMDVAESCEFSTLGNKTFSKLENLRIPVIAAVNGYALGGGCELAMACDIRIASYKAEFGQPEVGLGLIAGFGGTQRLARLVGSGIAKEILYAGEMINANRAYEIGLVNRVVDSSEVVKEARKLAQTIAAKSPYAVSLSKKAVNDGIHLELEQAIALETKLFSTLFSSYDQKEGISAFLEKRQPIFKGE